MKSLIACFFFLLTFFSQTSLLGQQACNDAIPITSFPFKSNVTTTCGQGDNLQIYCDGLDVFGLSGEEVIYRLDINMAPTNYFFLPYAVYDEESGALPLLSIYKGCPSSENQCLYSTFIIDELSDFTEPISFDENGVYYIVFDAYPVGCYEFNFQILEERQTQENDCSNAINLNQIESPYLGNTTLYSNDFEEDCLSDAPDQFFYVDVPADKALSIGLIGSSYDSQHRLAYGNNCPGAVSIICQDDPDIQTHNWFNSTGSTQRVWWVQDGFSGSSGSFVLAWNILEPKENDFCQNAIEIGCGQTLSGSTYLATPEEAAYCGTSLNTSNGVWHRFLGNGGNATVDLCGSDFDTKIGIYEGTCNALSCIDGGDDDGDCGSNPVITVPTMNGVTYYILITGYNANQGDYQITLDCDITTTSNLAITKIINLESACNLSSAETVTATIENQGTATQSNFQVGVKVDGITLFNEMVNNTLQAGETIDYTFNQTINLSTEKEYTIEVFTNLSNDQEPTNDALAITIEHLSGLEGTTLTASDDAICEGNFVSFNASGGTSYQWSHGNSTSSFNFDYPEVATTYSVTITDNLGCEAVQSATVGINPLPAQPIINPSTQFLCPGAIATLQTVPGNITWSTGENTPIITITQGSGYNVTITSDEGCSRVSESIFVRDVDPPTISVTNDGVICEGETARITVFGGSNPTYNWSTGETTQRILVTPPTTETYSVTVTYNGCTFIEETTAIIEPDLPAEKVSNMLPPNGASGIDLPVNFSWSPGENAGSYDLYVGLLNEELRYIRNTSQIQTTYSGSLSFGNTYCWQVVSRSCSGAEGAASPIQCFTLEFLPDLVVQNINTPTTTAFAGAEIVVNWQNQNNGRGPTRTGRWSETVFLSTDTELDNGDTYLGSAEFNSALEEGETGTNSAEVKLPICETGEYYLIVRTDAYRNVQEEEENNNVGVSASQIIIQSAPLPDLRIVGIPQLNVAGVVQAGESYELNYQITNQGEKATSRGFYNRIFISEESFYSPFSAESIEVPFYEEIIVPNTSVSLSSNITIPPELADGDYYIHIITDVSDRIEECDFEGNNIATTEPFSVLEIPKPNFIVKNVDLLADVASNKETITLRWEIENLEAPYTGSLTDQIFISSEADGFPIIYRTNFHEIVTIESESVIIRETTFDIPDYITGQFYIGVNTNRFGQVDETDLTDNTSGVDSFQVVSPNLTPRNLAALTTLAAGQRFTANWLLENIGEGDLLNGYIQDDLYLSINDELDFSEDINLEQVAGRVTIFSNNTLPRQTDATIPDGTVAGNYFLILVTNRYNQAYENGQTNDNSISIPITITEGQFPDLEAVAIEANNTEAVSGDFVNLTFIVENKGAVATTENWRDAIYYCTCSEWNPNEARLMTTQFRSQILPPNTDYSNTVSVRLPYTLQTGTYYFYLKTDSNNAIFEEDESDNSNITRSTPLSVTAYQNVDLAIQNVTPPNAIIFGQPANIYFETRNVGQTATFVENWFDGIVLSDDLVWDPQEDTIVIAQWQHNGNLSLFQRYATQENFTLPTSFSGQKYILLVTDLRNANNENNISNNAVILPPSGGTMGTTDPITFPPKPDLSVEIKAASSVGIAGQPLSIQYEVTNNSTEAMAMGDWQDAVAIATADNFFPNRALGYLTAPVTMLNPGATYTAELEFDIPITASGNNFLIVKTDIANSIQEELENNNFNSQYLRIIQPPPADLVIKEINALPLDTIATDMTTSWTVQNAGFNPANGRMTQGVYLSKNNTWEVSDILLGTTTDFITLNPNQEAEFQLTERLEGLERGDYFIIIRTDLQNNILENDDSNNNGTSIATTFIEVPAIIVDAPAINTDFDLQKPIFYRMEVDAALAGAAIRIALESEDATAFNELYVSLDTMPNRTTYDFGFDQAFSPNQVIGLPQVDTGTYYIMAYPVEGIAIQNISLKAAIIPYEITAINANEGGNTGQVTVKIKGGKFDQTMKISLQQGNDAPIAAESLFFINSTEAYVTFNLEGANLGVYDVKGNNDLGEEAILSNGFKIVTGTIANNSSPLDVSCGVNTGGQDKVFFVNVADELVPLELEKIHPAQVRPGQIIKIQIRYRNNGNVDLPIPERMLGSQNGYPLSRSETDFSQKEKGIHLFFPYEDGSQFFPFIPPGQSVIQEVFVKAEGGTGDVIKLRLFKL